MLFKKEDDDKQHKNNKNPFIAAFLLIMVSEWGDKTQIAAALFAIKYNPFLVLVGTMIALFILSIMAVYLGKIVSSKIDKNKVNLVAGFVFIILGIMFLLI